MTYRSHHGFIAVLIIAFITSCSAAWLQQTHEAQAQTVGTVCPSGNVIAVDSATTAVIPNAPIAPGPHQVSLSASSTLASAITNVRFTLDNQSTVLGRGVRLNTNPYWNMTWYSQVTPGGNHSIAATLDLTSGSCQIAPTPVLIANTGVLSGLISNPSPLRFDGYTNEPRDFTLQSTIGGAAGLDVTKWTVYKKNPVNLGAVTPADDTNSFRFSAGTVTGESAINVIAQYGGVSTPLTIPVKVFAQVTAAPQPTSGGTAAGTTTTTAAGTVSTTTKATAAANTSAATTAAAAANATLPATADVPIKNCVTSKLTEQRYQAVISGQERVTAAEFDELRQCFAIRNYVLQTNLLPVAADKTTIKTQPVSSDISIGSATNPVVQTSTSGKQVLKFSGKAKPNSIVLLYIFSEPLVLSTSTDANGDWSYSLEDPMQPGSHEAYALVNKGDGNYERSNVFGFVLAKAEAASPSSNGYSLKLDKNQPTSSSNRRPIVIYIIAVLGLIVGVLLIVAIVLMHRSHHIHNTTLTPDLDTPSPDPAINSVPVVTQTVAPTTTPAPAPRPTSYGAAVQLQQPVAAPSQPIALQPAAQQPAPVAVEPAPAAATTIRAAQAAVQTPLASMPSQPANQVAVAPYPTDRLA